MERSQSSIRERKEATVSSFQRPKTSGTDIGCIGNQIQKSAEVEALGEKEEKPMF